MDLRNKRNDDFEMPVGWLKYWFAFIALYILAALGCGGWIVVQLVNWLTSK